MQFLVADHKKGAHFGVDEQIGNGLIFCDAPLATGIDKVLHTVDADSVQLVLIPQQQAFLVQLLHVFYAKIGAIFIQFRRGEPAFDAIKECCKKAAFSFA